jgi:hypothetical protein
MEYEKPAYLIYDETYKYRTAVKLNGGMCMDEEEIYEWLEDLISYCIYSPDEDEKMNFSYDGYYFRMIFENEQRQQLNDLGQNLFECLSKKVNNPEKKVYRKIEQFTKEIICKSYMNLIRVKSKIVFYPVGQGLMVGIFLMNSVEITDVEIDFTGGIIGVTVKPNAEIYLYDCGSGNVLSKNAKSVINDFVRDCQKYCKLGDSAKPVIECLFISHFHADHVNGIPYLASRCIIKLITMAYQNPINGFLQYVSNLIEEESAADNEKGDRFALDEDYLEEDILMQVEPYDELRKVMSKNYQNVKIMRLYSHDAKPMGEILQEISEEERKEIGEIADGLFVTMNKSDGLENENANNIRVYDAYPKENLKDGDGYKNVSYWKKGLWEFGIIYYLPDQEEYEDVSRRFLFELGSVLGESWISENEINEEWCRKMVQLIKKDDNISKIRDTYIDLGLGPLNDLSMCLFLSSLARVECAEFDYYYRSDFEKDIRTGDILNVETVVYDCPGAVLLTGDTDLLRPISPEKCFEDAIFEVGNKGKFLPMSVIQLPHHGSKNNINEDVLNRLVDDVYTYQQMVVSYGFNNKYEHPSYDVCRHIGRHVYLRNRTKESQEAYPNDVFDGRILCRPEVDINESIINDRILYHCHEKSKVVFMLEHSFDAAAEA